MSKHKFHLYTLKKDTELFKEGDIVESYYSPKARKEAIVVTNRQFWRINPYCRCPQNKVEEIQLTDLIHLDTFIY